MKIVMIAAVIVGLLISVFLVVISFKLLRKTQKEELAERREMRKSGRSQAGQQQVHPQVAEELKRLDKIKKELEDKK